MAVGLDYGAVGEELLHNSNSWSNQWKLFGCHVQRFINDLFAPDNCSFIQTAPSREFSLLGKNTTIRLARTTMLLYDASHKYLMTQIVFGQSEGYCNRSKFIPDIFVSAYPLSKRILKLTLAEPFVHQATRVMLMSSELVHGVCT